jgi:hypothetical protein
MNETDFRVSGAMTKYGDAPFRFAVHSIFATWSRQGNACCHREGRLCMRPSPWGDDHLDTVLDCPDGDTLPVFVSAEVRKREPVGDLQSVFVLCRKDDVSQGTATEAMITATDDGFLVMASSSGCGTAWKPIARLAVPLTRRPPPCAAADPAAWQRLRPEPAAPRCPMHCGRRSAHPQFPGR